MVAARRLHNYGAHVEVVITKSPANFKEIPAHQLDILQQMNIPIYETGANLNTQNIDLILDGMLGYSLQGNPRGNVATLIEWANTTDAPILALDTPFETRYHLWANIRLCHPCYRHNDAGIAETRASQR